MNSGEELVVRETELLSTALSEIIRPSNLVR